MSSETGIQDVRVLIVRITKINIFGAKRNDIRITRIWEIYYFSQKIETYFSEKIIGRLQRFRTKKSKNNMKLQQNMRMCCKKQNSKREREGEKGGEQEQQREKGAKEQGRSLYTP